MALFFVFQKAKTQQALEIKIDTGNSNEIQFVQSNQSDSLQASKITFHKSDSNKIKITQSEVVKKKIKSENEYWNWISNTNNLIGIVVGLITIFSLVFFKLRKKQKK